MTFENIEVSHLTNAIRGMRNAYMSHGRSDSWRHDYPIGSEIPDDPRYRFNKDFLEIGAADDVLAHDLIMAGQPHRKFMRQISVIVDICKAPSYFWIELDTYKVGTVKDSSSTMHKITSRPLTADDFEGRDTEVGKVQLGDTVEALNILRENYRALYSDGKNVDAEKCFLDMKRMLPHDYLYERVTWSCSYENLIEIWKWRRNHRLPVWHEFCENFIKKLPYSEFITDYPG